MTSDSCRAGRRNSENNLRYASTVRRHGGGGFGGHDIEKEVNTTRI